MGRKLFIIPGFKEKPTTGAYKKIGIIAKNGGYQVIPIFIKWKRHVASEWVKDVTRVINKLSNKNDNITILGFSFGAYTTILYSISNLTISNLIICSLSPYFKDDLIKNSKINILNKLLGKRRMDDFKKHLFPKKIKIKATFLVGDKESIFSINRTKKAYKLWAGSKKIYLVKNSEHALDSNYLKEIKGALTGAP